MNSTMHDREMQLHALRGFAAWLPSAPSEKSEESSEITNQLLHVFQIYEWDLEQDVDGTPATEEWFNIVCATSMLASLLKEEFLEMNAGLVGYQPADEPATIEEKTMRLLSDAIVHFENCSRSEA